MSFYDANDPQNHGYQLGQYRQQLGNYYQGGAQGAAPTAPTWLDPARQQQIQGNFAQRNYYTPQGQQMANPDAWAQYRTNLQNYYGNNPQAGSTAPTAAPWLTNQQRALDMRNQIAARSGYSYDAQGNLIQPGARGNVATPGQTYRQDLRNYYTGGAKGTMPTAPTGLDPARAAQIMANVGQRFQNGIAGGGVGGNVGAGTGAGDHQQQFQDWRDSLRRAAATNQDLGKPKASPYPDRPDFLSAQRAQRVRHRIKSRYAQTGTPAGVKNLY